MKLEISQINIWNMESCPKINYSMPFISLVP